MSEQAAKSRYEPGMQTVARTRPSLSKPFGQLDEQPPVGRVADFFKRRDQPQTLGDGEIDLIVRRGRTVVFVEVKWRKSASELALALDHYRLRRVIAAAEVAAPCYVRPGDDVRIDAILLAPGHWPRHIANASLA